MSLRDPRTKSGMHLHARNPDPSGSRSHGDPTDIAIDTIKQVAKEQLIPQIANRTRNAISVDGRQVFLYQKLRSGRRCSCWAGINTSPHSGCPICFQTGFSGGFLKWGTHLFLFDPSRQYLAVNVLLNPLAGVPPWFSLEQGFTAGYIEWEEQMLNGTYYGLDHWRFEYRKSQGAVTLKMMLDGVDTAFVPFSETALKERILVARGGTFRFRVYLERAVASDPSPLFQFFSFRTLVTSAEPPVLTVDIPRRNENNALMDYGVLETFEGIQMVFSDEVKAINLEDVIIRLYDMTKWKVVGSSANDPQNILTSWDVQLTKIFADQGMYNVPI